MRIKYICFFSKRRTVQMLASLCSFKWSRQHAAYQSKSDDEQHNTPISKFNDSLLYNHSHKLSLRALSAFLIVANLLAASHIRLLVNVCGCVFPSYFRPIFFLYELSFPLSQNKVTHIGRGQTEICSPPMARVIILLFWEWYVTTFKPLKLLTLQLKRTSKS